MTGGKAISSGTGAPMGLDSGPVTGFLSRMSSDNCTSPLATQLHIMHSFRAVTSNPLPTLLLVMFLTALSSRTPARTNILHYFLHFKFVSFQKNKIVCTYHAHKLDFYSSSCVFLGYISSHLG